ncbi:uncharacterized protein LOC119109657 [Pollicipes pollicipes]|uniref:uncharacterized protein LOC119109657 n=1 Tax=Pollicipes pollicipes TaxID=41117 RepID=UPI00188588A2|nr:uncharacterized protein LOC119109657 [Pollicipes pollicipes]
MTSSMSGGQRTVLTLPARTTLAQPRPIHPGVSGVTHLVSSSLPRLVTQSVTHLVAPASQATMTVLGQPKMKPGQVQMKQLPMITPYISSASQSPLGKSMVVVTAAGLVPVSKH